MRSSAPRSRRRGRLQRHLLCRRRRKRPVPQHVPHGRAVWDTCGSSPSESVKTGTLEERRNIIVLATDADMPETKLLAAIEGRAGGIVTIPGFDAMGEDLYTEMIPLADVPVLSDSHAPTDSLIKVQ